MKDLSRVVFFNVSLANGHLMSTPVFEPRNALVGEIMRAIESESPFAAWVQTIFVQKNYSNNLIWLKQRIADAKREIETPRVSIFTGKELGDKTAKFREFYLGSSTRVRKLDDSIPKAHVLVDIQGMWVSEDDKEGRSRAHHLEEILPFSRCHDEIDRLAIYQYSDPRLLIELVERRMVTDISSYFRSYAGARMEPPSFIITPDELTSYVHVPFGSQIDKIRSLNWSKGVMSPFATTEHAKSQEGTGKVSILRTRELPSWDEKLDENVAARLAMLASAKERSFELVYQSGEMSVLISSKVQEDLLKYRNLMESVYGGIKFDGVTDPRPEFLKELPKIVY